jgi:hypothetical protein
MPQSRLVSFSRHLMERPRLTLARAEAVSLPCGMALRLLTQNLMGIGGSRAHIRIVLICGTPPSDFGLSFPRAGAVFLAASSVARPSRAAFARIDVLITSRG